MSLTSAYPELFARHYDSDYEMMRDASGDIGFYGDLARESGGPVLEVACGTGRVLLPIAEEGYDVTGVDLAPAMLSLFARKLDEGPAEVRDRVTLVEGSFTKLGCEGPFGFVFSAFRAFQHIETVDEQRRALTAWGAAVRPGGLVAFDVFDFNTRHTNLKDSATWFTDYRLQDDGHERQRQSRARYDADAKLLHASFRWLSDDDEFGRGDFVMRISTRDELAQLVTEAGLELVEIFGEFDRSAWDADRPRELVVVARRPG